jgi:hypothetical protein
VRPLAALHASTLCNLGESNVEDSAEVGTYPVANSASHVCCSVQPLATLHSCLLLRHLGKGSVNDSAEVGIQCMPCVLFCHAFGHSALMFVVETPWGEQCGGLRRGGQLGILTPCRASAVLFSLWPLCTFFLWSQWGQTLVAGHTQQPSEPDCQRPTAPPPPADTLHS